MILYGEHLKGADTKTLLLYVLLPFISHIRVKHSGSFPAF